MTTTTDTDTATDTEHSDRDEATTGESESQSEELSPAERTTAAIERLVEKKDRRRHEASAPLDLEDGSELRTGTQQQTAEVYKECLDRGLDDVAACIQNAPTETEQRKRAATVRVSGYRATADELQQSHVEVREKYREDE